MDGATVGIDSGSPIRVHAAQSSPVGNSRASNRVEGGVLKESHESSWGGRYALRSGQRSRLQAIGAFQFLTDPRSSTVATTLPE